MILFVSWNVLLVPVALELLYWIVWATFIFDIGQASKQVQDILRFQTLLLTNKPNKSNPMAQPFFPIIIWALWSSNVSDNLCFYARPDELKHKFHIFERIISVARLSFPLVRVAITNKFQLVFSSVQDIKPFSL